MKFSLSKIKKSALLLLGAASLAFAQVTAANNPYVVVSGDTVCEIADKLSVSCTRLIEVNQLGLEGLIFPGQVLNMPGTAVEEKKGETAPSMSEPPQESETIQEAGPSTQTQEKDQSVGASSSSTSDLWLTYVLARANDPVFAANDIRRSAVKQGLPQARAGMRPQLNFTSSLSRNYDDYFEESDSLRSSISINQSLYNPSNTIAIQQAKSRIAAAEANYREAEQDLILRVTRAYFSVLKNTDNLILSEKNQEALGRQLDLALERLKAGLNTRTDLFDAEARYESAIADGIEASRLLDHAKQGLMLLTGNNPGALSKMRLSSRLTSPVPNEPDIWINAALESNNELLAEKHNLSVLRLEAAKRRATRLPSLEASLSGSFTDTEKKNTTQTTFTLRLSVPILKGGLMRSQIKEADLNLQAAYRNYESSRRQIYIQTRGAFLSISSRLRRIEALAGAVRSSERALRAKSEGFAAGLDTNIVVLDGKRDLFLAKLNYLKERYDYAIDVLALDALIGDLTEEDLRRVNAWLD